MSTVDHLKKETARKRVYCSLFQFRVRGSAVNFRSRHCASAEHVAVLEPYRTFPDATYPFTVDVKARSCKKVMWRTTSGSTHLQFVRAEARLVCVVLSHIEARLVCATGLCALSPLDFSASIRDGLVCDLGFYPRLYGTSKYFGYTVVILRL